MARKRPTARRGQQRVSIADEIRLGPQAAQAKAQMTPAQWRAVVKHAHARGFTVAGAISGVPDPLKERTRKSLIEEAQRVTAAAFKPAEKELNDQEGKVRALDAKRQTDEAHFREWLANQHQAMATQALTADTALAERQQQIHVQTQAGYQQAQQTATQNAAATPGNVSNPAESTALNLAPEAQRANEQVATQRQLTAQMSNNARGYQLAGQAVSMALSQQAEARRTSETAAALSEVREARGDLSVKAAAAAAEEIRRLFGVEIEKADANRNFAVASEKLGIDMAELRQKTQDQLRDERFRRDKLKSEEARAEARIAADYARIESSAQQKEADRKLRERLAAMGASGQAITPAQRAASTKAAGKLAFVAADIKRTLTDKKNGVYVGRTKDGKRRPLRQIILTRANGAVSSVEYELALDLAVNGKLSAVNRKRAAQLGILNPADL